MTPRKPESISAPITDLATFRREQELRKWTALSAMVHDTSEKAGAVLDHPGFPENLLMEVVPWVVAVSYDAPIDTTEISVRKGGIRITSHLDMVDLMRCIQKKPDVAKSLIASGDMTIICSHIMFDRSTLETLRAITRVIPTGSRKLRWLTLQKCTFLSKQMDLTGINLSYTSLVLMDFSTVNLARVDFRYANLDHASLRDAACNNADFCFASMVCTLMTYDTVLKDAKIQNTYGLDHAWAIKQGAIL